MWITHIRRISAVTTVFKNLLPNSENYSNESTNQMQQLITGLLLVV
jgi:hypothetical protein